MKANYKYISKYIKNEGKLQIYQLQFWLHELYILAVMIDDPFCFIQRIISLSQSYLDSYKLRT